MSEKTEEKLSIYRVVSRNTGVTRHIGAASAQEACQSAGLLMEDALIVQLEAKWRKPPDGEAGFMIQVPVRVCPFQFAQCQKPPGDPCPVTGNFPDVQEWLKAATRAHLCSHVGHSVLKKDYEKGMMWMTTGEAILYVTAKAV